MSMGIVRASEDNSYLWDSETEHEKLELEAQFGVLRKLLYDWSSEILWISYSGKIRQNR